MKEKKKIGRREFLKVAGTGAAVTTAALYGCKPRSAGSASEADGARQGQMTYRTNPKTGDRVSLLGYGCMRWPTVSGSDDIDQEMVNALVDHAIAHAVQQKVVDIIDLQLPERIAVHGHRSFAAPG